MLAQEPWCYTPDQIGELTDWQILNLYAKPAAERAAEFDQSLPARGGSVPAGEPIGKRRTFENKPDFEPGTDGHRRQCIAAFMQVQGLSLDRAKAQYERQLAQWRAEQGA